MLCNQRKSALNSSTPPISIAIATYLFHVNATLVLSIHPNASIKAATKSCDIRIVDIATVGLRLFTPSITVIVMIKPKTPPSK